LSGTKGNLGEGGIRVPFIARWPGHIAAGKVIDQPIVSPDLFTTFAAVGGAKPPNPVDGVNVLPVLEGKAKSPHKMIFWQFNRQAAVRQGPWKLLRQEGKADHLYNLDQDIGEKNDLAAAQPQRVKELGAALAKWLKGLKNSAH
jgi:arylsulfatase A-like enzyme